MNHCEMKVSALKSLIKKTAGCLFIALIVWSGIPPLSYAGPGDLSLSKRKRFAPPPLTGLISFKDSSEGGVDEVEKVDSRPMSPIILPQELFDLPENFQLYVGNDEATKKPTLLKEQGITEIISLYQPSSFKSYGPEFVEDAEDGSKQGNVQIYRNLADSGEINIKEKFPKTYAFLDREMHKPGPHRVLIHCQMGISRSSTIAAAFLMKWLIENGRGKPCSSEQYPDQVKKDLTKFLGRPETEMPIVFQHCPSEEQVLTDLVIAILQKSRPQIDPNYGFHAQLREYAKEQLKLRDGVKVKACSPTDSALPLLSPTIKENILGPMKGLGK